MARIKILQQRRWVQWIMAVVVGAIGIQFTLWVRPHLRGEWPSVSRPPGVEAFLPIDAMLGLRHLLTTGEVTSVHPAGLAIFIGVLLMSIVLAKSFCSHVCPVGFASELIGNAGQRLLGRNFKIWKWLDIPLRSLKFLLLGFFVWAVWYAMNPQQVEHFLASPYAKVVDTKMWLFFAPPSRVTVAVIGVLAVGSFFIRDLWCRYLCPYGALVGVLGRFAVLKVTRDESLCTDCRECTRVCPARLPVHQLQRVSSIECTSCQDCVVACPAKGCLEVRTPKAAGRRSIRPVAVVVLAIAVYLSVLAGFRLTGHWHTSVTEQEFNRRLQGNLNTSEYSHVGR